MGHMSLGREPKPGWILKIAEHGGEVSFGIGDMPAGAFQCRQILNFAHGLGRVARPVSTGLEPSRVAGGVVVLFDRLIKDFHSVAGGPAGNLAQIVEIVLHDDGLQENPERQIMLGSHPYQRIERLAGSFEEVFPAADLRIGRAGAVERDRDAPRVCECEPLDPGLIAPVAVGKDLQGKPQGNRVPD